MPAFVLDAQISGYAWNSVINCVRRCLHMFTNVLQHKRNNSPEVFKFPSVPSQIKTLFAITMFTVQQSKCLFILNFSEVPAVELAVVQDNLQVNRILHV